MCIGLNWRSEQISQMHIMGFTTEEITSAPNIILFYRISPKQGMQVPFRLLNGAMRGSFLGSRV